ncbi:MAG TPA: thiol reductant ABC exporter subunit CydC [Gaiellaceae bacterium]|nr:thiol reductant ABC exporter subunit CydC [Gaiellaceae bacterium]
MTATLRRLLALAGASRARLATAVLLGTATIVFGVGLMATAGYLISRAAERPAILSLTVAIVGVRFFGIARPVVRYFERLRSHELAFRVLERVRRRVYERIEPLSPVQLQGDRRGETLSTLVADVDSQQNLHLRGIAPPLVAFAAGAVSVGVAAVFLPAAGIVLAAGLLAAGLGAPALSAALSRRAGGHEAAARGELAAELVEITSGSAELVAYGRQRDHLDQLRAADRRLVRLRRRAALADGLGDGLRLLLMGATVVAVLAVGVSSHASGGLDRVLIAMLALLALASFEAVQPLPEAARELGETVAAGRRIFALTDRKPAVVDAAEPAALPDGPFTVAVEDVRVRYGPREPLALDGFSLRLEPGRRIALIGPSGAGKTTVTNLLLRFLDPEQGRITLAGRDVREYGQEDVRSAIAVAGQDAHLFSASIGANVRLGRPGASDDAVEQALAAARILDWVRSLPEGLDTLVGEEGRELSGGQRQRIALARALLADTPILVLDEPTAHLDTPTAERLVEDVVAEVGDRCVLLITHRPEGLELVDEIVVLRPPER